MRGLKERGKPCSLGKCPGKRNRLKNPKQAGDLEPYGGWKLKNPSWGVGRYITATLFSFARAYPQKGWFWGQINRTLGRV